MTPWLKARCDDACSKIKAQQLWRSRRPSDFISATHVMTPTGACLQFASNDYLGFAHQQRGQGGVAGAGASALVSGYSSAHQTFEQEIAKYLGFDAALYFHSGFAANEAALSTLLSKNDVVFGDRLNHASLIDGVQKSGARYYRFPHCSIDGLSRLLETKPVSEGGQRWIVTDAVFSMDGDIAPLKELVALAQKFDAALYVDDAHGFGVFGDGRGTCAALGISPEDIDVLMVTCGKAMGVMGGTLLGHQLLINTLIQKSRSYVYSTAAPPMVMSACSLALAELKNAHHKRLHLQALCAYLHSELNQIAAEFGYATVEQKLLLHPVQPLIVGDESLVLRFNRWLLKHGLCVGAIRPPTVPSGTARLRLSLNAEHSFHHVDELCSGLRAFSQGDIST